jgi:hypothetical protein
LRVPHEVLSVERLKRDMPAHRQWMVHRQGYGKLFLVDRA